MLPCALHLTFAARVRPWCLPARRTTAMDPASTSASAIGNQTNASAAISIHADEGPATGRGFEVIQPGLDPGYNNGIIAPSHVLALDVRQSYLMGTGVPYSSYQGVAGLDTRTDLGG